MKRAWLIESTLFLLYFAFGISWLAYSPLMPEIEKQFGIEHAQAGSIISAVSLAKAFVPLLIGILAARIGVGRSILVGAILSSLSLLAPGLSDFKALLAVRFFFGVGGAILVTLMGSMVMKYFTRDQLPLINGINNVAVNAGITAAFMIALPLSHKVGWQQTLWIFGGLNLALAVVWAFLVLGENEAENKKAEAETASWGEVVRLKETWLLALAFTGPLSLYLALNTWLPTHYVETFGLTRQDASGLTSYFNMVGIPTAVFGGLFTKKFGLRRPFIILAGLLMVPSAFGLVAATIPALRLASAIVLGMSFFLYVSPLFTIPMELPGANAARVGLMNGVVYSVAYTVSFASPLLVGYLKTQTQSYFPGLGLCCALSGTLVIAGLLLPETGPARKQATE